MTVWHPDNSHSSDISEIDNNPINMEEGLLIDEEYDDKEYSICAVPGKLLN